MGAFVPGTRIEAALKKLPEGERAPLSDYRFEVAKSAALNKAHEEKVLELAAGQNVYTYDQFDASIRHNIRLCFYGDSEWEVLDRLGVAEVMLG